MHALYIRRIVAIYILGIYEVKHFFMRPIQCWKACQLVLEYLPTLYIFTPWKKASSEVEKPSMLSTTALSLATFCAFINRKCSVDTKRQVLSEFFPYWTCIAVDKMLKGQRF
jgi:hypothetical protein